MAKERYTSFDISVPEITANMLRAYRKYLASYLKIRGFDVIDNVIFCWHRSEAQRIGEINIEITDMHLKVFPDRPGSRDLGELIKAYVPPSLESLGSTEKA